MKNRKIPEDDGLLMMLSARCLHLQAAPSMVIAASITSGPDDWTPPTGGVHCGGVVNSRDCFERSIFHFFEKPLKIRHKDH